MDGSCTDGAGSRRVSLHCSVLCAVLLIQQAWFYAFDCRFLLWVGTVGHVAVVGLPSPCVCTVVDGAVGQDSLSSPVGGMRL